MNRQLHPTFCRDHQRGLALLMVLVLLMVMVLVVSEMLSGSQIQRLATENQMDEHLSFYGEEVALLKAEEILFQDIEPPPMKPLDQRFMTPEQLKIEENSKGTDSYHDHWASLEDVEKNGESWLLTRVSDEERRFNINTLVDVRTGNLIPKNKEFLEDLLKILKVKDAEIPSFIDEIKDQLDPDTTGKYENKLRNGPFKLLSQILDLEHVDETLYYGKNFPDGELRLREDEFSDPLSFEEEEDDFENDPAKMLKEKKAEAYEDWDSDEIFAGLKDVLTVYGDGKINVNTASLPVLTALFKGDEKAALEVIRARKLAPLRNLEDLKNISGTTNGVSHYGNMMAFQSNYFRVILTIQERRVRKQRVSMMMRSGSQAITLFRGAIL